MLIDFFFTKTGIYPLETLLGVRLSAAEPVLSADLVSRGHRFSLRHSYHCPRRLPLCSNEIPQI